MTEYVLCYVERDNKVLFVKKQKPAWQKDQLNLPGGKIEHLESPCGAARRELKEETNLDSSYQSVMGTLEGDDWRVHVVHCGILSGVPKALTDEPILWLAISEFQHYRIIENLNIIIPLCHADIRG